MTRRRRSGFTLIELVMVVTILGALSAVAVPKFRDAKRRAIAMQVLTDVEIVRAATYSFYSDSGYFLREYQLGVVPKSLSPYLPLKFSFKKPAWTLDYENWSLKSGSQYIKTGVLIGVSVTTTDPLVGATAMDMFGNQPAFTIGSKYTFMIAGM